MLVVEDVPTNRLIAERLLGRLGVTPVLANDGAEGLRHLSEAPFDLVLMDIEMPGMDGFEATRLWRAKETGSRVPILALTAHAMVDHGQRVLEAGMDDLLAKPIRLADLAQALARWLPEAVRRAS